MKQPHGLCVSSSSLDFEIRFIAFSTPSEGKKKACAAEQAYDVIQVGS
ncbi:Uncharacterized protein APZ42_015483 [Daphnia magna]|uniref:Uncharacterized protein n=1 Tax=Daphnia magna TaxID=35525 RepID=A0A162PHV9_9CRUS|nr:Uncharacterized protein APZ42_015483 [Daphnia magna]